MEYLEPIVGLILAILTAVGIYKVRESGKDAEKLDNAESELEAVDKAKSARDALDRDPTRRDRLRNRNG
jgi:hypothetical protein